MTAAVAIDSAAAEKIAAQYAAKGAPLPEAMRGNPAMRKAYKAAGGTDAGPEPAGEQRAGDTPPEGEPKQQANPDHSPRSAGKGRGKGTPSGKRRPPRGPGWLTRSVSPSRAAGRLANTGPGRLITRGGDGGGLLLALVVYPVFISTLRYGAAGPGDWFRAKWLNKPTGTPAAAPAAAAGHGELAPHPGQGAPAPHRNRRHALGRLPAGHRHPGGR